MTDLTPYEQRDLVAADPTGGRLIAWAQAATAAHSLAQSLARTSFVPKAFQGNPSDATAAIILGDELGLSPLSALRSLYIIGGTPALYARTMTGLVRSHGHEIWTVEETEQKVTVAGRRRGSDHEERVTWTIARAQKAGYTSNKKYSTDPIAMLYARAAGDVARRIAPDVLAGVPYSVEEIELSETPTVPVSRETAKRTVRRAAPAAEPEEPPLDEQIHEPATEPDPITDAQLKKVNILVREQGITDRPAALLFVGQIVGREIDSTKSLSKAEAHEVIETLQDSATKPEPTDVDPTLDPTWGES